MMQGINGTTTGHDGYVLQEDQNNTHAIDWSEEDKYWRKHYPHQSYFDPAIDYFTYQPAYRYGYALHGEYGELRYEDLNESQLGREWLETHPLLPWEKAKYAVREAYYRAWMWASEDRYWQEAYNSRPYYHPDIAYMYVRPAYRYGHDLYYLHRGTPFDMLSDEDLRLGFEQLKHKVHLTWDRAHDAVKDAYHRLFDREQAPTKHHDFAYPL